MKGIRSVRWSWWLIAALLALALYQVTPLLYPRTIQGSESAMSPPEPGDTIPNVDFFPVSHWSGAFFDWRGRGPRDLGEGSCVVLGFFLSTCPACERLASDWTRSDTVEVRGESLPFFWVGGISDRGARGWLERHSFENAFLVRPSGFAKFRVNYVPQLFVLSKDGVLLHRGLLSPAELDVLRTEPGDRIGNACLHSWS